MSPQGGVLCAGGIVHDTIIRPFDELRWGTTTFVDAMESHGGGSAANTARALAILGSRVRILGTVGNDQAAASMLRIMADDGVDVSALQHTELPNAATVVLVNARGDRQFLHRPGSSSEAFRFPLVFTEALLEGMRHFHLAGFFVMPHLRHSGQGLLRDARAAGLTTSLDTSWDPQGDWLRALSPCLPYVDILFLNEDESRMLTGSEEPVGAARLLQDAGANLVVQKLGGRGCVAVPRTASGDPVPCTPFRVQPVDSTGAGDCFAAGFLSSYLQAGSLADAAMYGNAAGALSVRMVGSVAGLLAGEQLERWLKETPRS